MNQHETKLPNQFVSVTLSLTSGAIAGAIAKSSIAPLDRTKIAFQVSADSFTWKKAYLFLVRSYSKGGVRHLWKGNSATMVRIVPYAAIQFTAHEQIKILFGSVDNNPLPPGPRLLAGSLSGVSASFCTYPLDLMRARLAITNKYTTLHCCFRTIIHEEGYHALYNGFLPTILGIIPYAGISFFIYETLKSWHYDKYGKGNMSAIDRLMFGAMSGLCGQSMTYPLDIVRRRMQTDGLGGSGRQYRSLVATCKHVLETEGVTKGYFKGMSVNWVKGPVAIGISFMTFDTVKKYLELLFYLDS